MRRPKAPELRLLLACARAHTTAGDEAAIRQLLEDGIDWTVFAQKAVAHGLAGLAGHTLARLVPDLVPDDIQAAFAAFLEQTRKSNQALLEELAGLIELLAQSGIETIPFKGPVLARQAFGDLGLRGFRDLDFLIRDHDRDETVRVLCDRGYERRGTLTPSQFEMIHRLQGQEILFKRDTAAIEPHTRLTSLKMALDIDYGGLWHRARRQDIFGHQMLTLAPEDTLLVLAVHGGKELWWDIKWACDVADFIAAHPGLDWTAIAARARAQGCFRMLLVAASLARNYLGAEVPDSIAAVQASDSVVGEIVDRIMTRWESDDPGGPPSNKTLSMDRLLLHDGAARQASYVVRTLFLPGPQHIPLIALPRSLSFAYIPIGIGHDRIALPLYRAYEWICARAMQVGNSLSLSPIAVALAPISAETRKSLKRLQQLYWKARRDLAADSQSSQNWVAVGDVLTSMNRYREAVEAYDRALAIMPDQRSVWQKRNTPVSALRKAGDWPKPGEAPASDIKDATGWAMRAGFLAAAGRHAEAAQASDSALQLDPTHEAAIRIGIESRLFSCDWSRWDEDRHIAKQRLTEGRNLIKPLSFRMMFDAEAESQECARLWTRSSSESRQPWRDGRYNHDKIRVAYLSTDLRSHPVGATIIAPLEHHDKSRFEITALSLIKLKEGRIQQRTRDAVDRFIDVHAMADEAVAAMLRELEIDIAVDLNGLTGARRSGIFKHRPAPLQVNYLGYPGTTTMPFMDYIIADRTVIPEANHVFYSEKVAYLPHSYLPYDRQRRISETAPSRREEGLPETGFVFASFNRLNKISPQIFDVWMRLLRGIEGSILWMPKDDSAIMANLQREAAVRGVTPSRLIFAGFKENSGDHLARLRLGDLFLDTLPYNAHTTASDALWAGLPILTCQGQAFQARVAAGLLRAIDLPEMITTSLDEYEQRAFALARNPVQLAAIRRKLADNRDTTPLFDTAGFTRGLEAVYRTMWEHQQSGRSPESFCVADGQ